MGCTVIGLCWAAQAKAEGVKAEDMDMSFLARLFVQAEESTGIPRYLFAAIAAQESSFWPWSINVSGRSYYPASKKEALATINGASSFDLGIMQINSWWLSKFGVSAEDALDPAINVFIGSTILMDCIHRYGIWDGIACYHAGSPKKQHGASYAAKVVAKWRTLTDINPGQ